MGVAAELLRDRTQALHEFNPMLGHRGCRLAISYPEIAEMQARAIFEAAIEVATKAGEPVVPEIMVPLVATRAELDLVKAMIDKAADFVEKERGARPNYSIGTMIELPRAAIEAAKIAETAEFFSFGTNDLTQNDVRHLARRRGVVPWGHIRPKAILANDPFVTLDREGVGELIAIAAERGRKVRPGIKLGICGEHGGDPSSIEFCEEIGLDYVSCSPFRVPIARLAAAQAALKAKGRQSDPATRQD